MATMYSGKDFSPPIHSVAEGPTDPTTKALPNPFVVLVAGGSKGIGLGIVQAYAKAGASGIVIISRTQSDLDTAAKSVLKINPNVKMLCQECDMTSEEDVKELVEATTKLFGRLDVLVISAGSATNLTHTREGGLKDWPVGIIEGPPSEMERLWKMHVHGPYMLQHYFLPLLEETKSGAQAIIQISSAAAHYTKAELMPASYSLTKFASTRLIQLTHEGHHKNGIVAFALQPGGVSTDITLPQGRGWEKRKYTILSY
jgi:NAD(P)-dependent dehydrogenase (short-subunit alcohol dehydrogenase family)